MSMFFYVKYKKIEVFCIFFEKNFVVSQILFTFAPEMPAHVRVGTLKTYIDGTRPQAICTASLEGRFRTLLSVRSNLATLNLNAAVMQQKRLRGLIFISFLRPPIPLYI